MDVAKWILSLKESFEEGTRRKQKMIDDWALTDETMHIHAFELGLTGELNFWPA